MTLVHLESCENPVSPNASAAGLIQMKGYTVVSGMSSIANGRTGNYWGYSGGVSVTYPILAAEQHATMVMGFALRWQGTPLAVGTQTIIAEFKTPAGGGIVQLAAARVSGDLGNGMRLRVIRSRDSVLLGETSAAIIDNAAWYYTELKVVVGGAGAGSFDLRTNEVSRVSGTADTLPTTGTTVGQVTWAAPSITGGNWDQDDICVCNGAGAINNTFLGDTTVHFLYPTAAGDLTQFTPVPNTSANWQNVDDLGTAGQTPGDGDYNESTVVTFTDLYNFADLPAGVAGRTVHGLIHWAKMYSSALPRSGAMVTRSGVVDTTGTTITFTTTNTGYRSAVQETKPGGGAWTTTDVNSSQHGAKVVS